MNRAVGILFIFYFFRPAIFIPQKQEFDDLAIHFI